MSFRLDRLRITLLTLGAFLISLSVSDLAAQSRHPLLSASLGIIRNAQSESSQTQYALYPEVQYTGNILEAPSGMVSLDWSVYAGGWSEDVLVPVVHETCLADQPVGNCPQSVHSSVLAGVRLHVVLSKSADYFSFFGGFSRQYVWEDWLLRPFDAESTGTNLLKLNAVEAGMRVQFSVSPRTLVGGTFQVYFSGADSGLNIRRRPAYSIVVSRRML